MNSESELRLLSQLDHPSLGLGPGCGLSAGGNGAVPALDLSFVSGVLNEQISFTRSSSATRINASGLVEVEGNNIARFDYDPVTLEPQGLLVEEQRTNKVTYSEQLGNVAWSKGNVTVVDNQTTGPDGNTAAEKISEFGAGPAMSILVSATSSATTNYTLSIFLKAGSLPYVLIGAEGAAGIVMVAVNFSTWALTTAVVEAASTVALVGCDIIDVGGGWRRVWLTYTTKAAPGSQHFVIRPSRDGLWANRGYTPAGADYCYAWGAQFEEGGGPSSSYIPTTSSQLTRSADAGSFTLPAGVSTLRFTFDDNGTQEVAVSPGSYNIPTNLNRPRIKRIRSIST